jgi:hypothetical protein
MTKLFASEVPRPRACRNSPDIFVILALLATSPVTTRLPVSPYAEFMMSGGGSLTGMLPLLNQPRGDK